MGLVAVASQAPLLPASEMSSSGNKNLLGAELVLPEFTSQKNLAKEVERLRTEVAGAPFTLKLFREKPDKRKSDGDDCVALGDLLQPKKKARAAKRKAVPKPKAAVGASSATETKEELEQDVVDHIYGSSRQRWWVDDLLSCLIHAAGTSDQCSTELMLSRVTED